jgi:hypothetical protein
LSCFLQVLIEGICAVGIDTSNIRNSAPRANNTSLGAQPQKDDFRTFLKAKDGQGWGATGGFGAGTPPQGFWAWVKGNIVGAAGAVSNAITNFGDNRPNKTYWGTPPGLSGGVKTRISPKMGEEWLGYSYVVPAAIVLAAGTAGVYGGYRLYNRLYDPGYRQVPLPIPSSFLPEIQETRL